MAWQTLSNNEPFNAPAPAPDLDKVIILLTDGDNTQNRWTNSSSSIDSRTEKACDNVKAANIKLYTVRVINGNATLLKNCATKPDMYYDVDNAERTQRRVLVDRAEPRQPAHREISAATSSELTAPEPGAAKTPAFFIDRFNAIFKSIMLDAS